MLANNHPTRTVWLHPEKKNCICIIDQRFLPHEFKVVELNTVEDVFHAIADMQVRGAPLICVTAAFGMFLATVTAPQTDFESFIQISAAKLISARPTAVNLAWGVNKQLEFLKRGNTLAEKQKLAFQNALQMADADVEICRQIGIHGLSLIKAIYNKKNNP